MRNDLNIFQSISPGYVSTEILEVANVDINTVSATPLPALESEDIAEAVVYVIGTPQRVVVTELTIRPLGDTV